MSLFFRKTEQRSGDWLDNDTGFDSRGISAEKATHLAPVYSAMRFIVDFLSTLPMDAYLMNGDTRQETELPELFTSQDEPGRPGLGPWIGQAGYGLGAHGNAVGWIVETDDFGYPTVVNWLRRDWWSFDETNKQWYVAGQPVGSSNILHIPWIVPPGYTLGLSPIEHYAAIVKAGLSAQDYADVRRGGGLPPAVLKNTQQTFAPDAAAVIRDRAVAAFSTGKPFVTGNDWDLNISVIPPSHAQFIETLKLTASQIAAIYGIDPREVGGEAVGSLTYSTDESRSLNRANDMRPYMVRLENAFNRVLPPRKFVKLNVDATFRTDLKTRTEVIGAKLKDGRLNLNESRALDDMPPVQGGDFHNAPAPSTDPKTRGELP